MCAWVGFAGFNVFRNRRSRSRVVFFVSFPKSSILRWADARRVSLPRLSDYPREFVDLRGFEWFADELKP